MFVGRVFQLGRRPQQANRLIALSFGLREPGCGGMMLDLYLRRPVIPAFGRADRLLDRRQLLDLLLSSRRVAAARGANRTRKMKIGFGKAEAFPGELRRVQLE